MMKALLKSPKHQNKQKSKKEIPQSVQPKRPNASAMSMPISSPERVANAQAESWQQMLANRDELMRQVLENERPPKVSPSPIIQTKLTLGPVGDKYEQEADTVAKQVVNNINQTSTQAPVQRQEEDEVMAKRVQRQEEEEMVQMKTADSHQAQSVSPNIESHIQSQRGSGQPLNQQIRAPMERAFGADFSSVQIHTNSQSDVLNRSLQARAFTSGQDIFFRQGEYNPGSSGGQELIAHELTHVVQQNGNQVQRKPGQANVQVQQRLPAFRLSAKKTKKHLDFIRIKKKDTHIAKMLLSKMKLAQEPDDAYGHWWVEVGDLDGNNWVPAESYGWWPSQSVNIKETLGGVPGSLNRGNATQDPHHGDTAETEYHPIKEVEEGAGYDTVRTEVLQNVRNFAQGFSGSWNWRLGWGKNCHTFVDRLKKQLKLHHQTSKQWLRRPDSIVSLADASIDERVLKKVRDSDMENQGHFFGFNPDIVKNFGISERDYQVVSPETRQAILDYFGVTADDMNDYFSRAYDDEAMHNLFY